MCLWGFLTGQYGPSAKVADGRLVMSMPDAETPVIWVMDLGDAATSVLRLETDKQGLSVIKKHGSKGAAETVAVYRSRKKAEKALVKASYALEKARDSRLHVGPNAQPVIIRPASLLGRIFTGFLYIWFALYLGMTLLGGPSTSSIPMGDLEKISQEAAKPLAESQAQTDGMPMSADEFLKQQTQKMRVP